MSLIQPKLSEKTVILLGPLSPSVQAIANSFVELGADLALMTNHLNTAERFCNGLNDLRENYPNFGRAAAFRSGATTATEAHEEVSRVAEAFGGLDVFVDAQLFPASVAIGSVHKEDSPPLDPQRLLTAGALRFLKGRKRGRIIYLLHTAIELDANHEIFPQYNQAELPGYIKSLAAECIDFNVTVNGVSVGASEEYLLASHSTETSITSALSDVQNIYPKAQQIDATQIANLVTFLSSSLSSSITGQVIKISAGMDLIIPNI